LTAIDPFAVLLQHTVIQKRTGTLNIHG